MSFAGLQVTNAAIQQVECLLPRDFIAQGNIGSRLIRQRTRPIHVGLIARQKVIEGNLHCCFDRRKVSCCDLGFEIALLVSREYNGVCHVAKLTDLRSIVTVDAVVKSYGCLTIRARLSHQPLHALNAAALRKHHVGQRSVGDAEVIAEDAFEHRAEIGGGLEIPVFVQVRVR
jgi:hypothetical protein